jgi:hypothetical protein
MGDLRRNQLRLRELADFIVSREGFINHFYCDPNGLVTIGIGTLVPTEANARIICADASLYFTFAANPQQRATINDVATDWRRVQARPGLQKREYRNVAQLRLDPGSIRQLMMQEISRSANALYQLHPFLLSFDERVAMAFVDTRYNPARLNPYRSPQVRPLWDALDPRNPQFNLNNAVALFERLWANRGGHLARRYSTRHWQRTQWLRQGLEAMGATRGGLRSI